MALDGYRCKVLKDSISPDNVRLTSLEIRFPRIALPQMNTHRMLSKSTASTRAIPVKKMIQQVMEDPYIPHEWGTNQSGMVSGIPLEADDALICERAWLRARDSALEWVTALADMNVHKELANQLLIPWMWTTMIISGTEWDNFINLRTNFDVGKPIKPIAEMIKYTRENSIPEFVNYGQWHRPYFTEEDCIHNFETENLNKISVGRCARVSYLNHDGKRELEKDIRLAETLKDDFHMTPWEHVARPAEKGDKGRIEWIAGTRLWEEHRDDPHIKEMWFGNYRSWVQARKLIPGEEVFIPGNK